MHEFEPNDEDVRTAINYGFVEETGILITVDEILEEKRMRHIQSFIEKKILMAVNSPRVQIKCFSVLPLRSKFIPQANCFH